jgi:hypothetical protein
MSSGVFRPYPSQQPKRYDATVFAPAAQPYQQGPAWELRAALRREESRPQIPGRTGLAVFASPPASLVPPAPRLLVPAAVPSLPQVMVEQQAPFLTPASAPFLVGPGWDMRAAHRRADISSATQQPQAEAAALLDDTVLIVGADTVQPIGVYVRENRGLPLPSPPLAAINAPPPVVYLPPQPVKTVPAPLPYPTQPTIVQDLAPFSPAAAPGIPPNTISLASFVRSTTMPQWLTPPSAAFGVAPQPFTFGAPPLIIVRDARPVLLPPPTGTAALTGPDVLPPRSYVQGTFARMQFAWAGPATLAAAVLAASEPVVTIYVRGELLPLDSDDRRITPQLSI